MFAALVLFLAILLAADGDKTAGEKIDEEEEKLPSKCHGTCV